MDRICSPPSFGGVVAFEMARQLERDHESVAFLGMFDSVAPLSAHHPTSRDDRREDALRLTTMAEAIGRFLGQPVEISYEELSALPADAQIDVVVEALKRTSALPPGEEQKLIRNLLHVSRPNIRGHPRLQPEAAAVPITLFASRTHSTPTILPPTPTAAEGFRLGWDVLTTARLRIVEDFRNHVTHAQWPHTAKVSPISWRRTYTGDGAPAHA